MGAGIVCWTNSRVMVQNNKRRTNPYITSWELPNINHGGEHMPTKSLRDCSLNWWYKNNDLYNDKYKRCIHIYINVGKKHKQKWSFWNSCRVTYTLNELTWLLIYLWHSYKKDNWPIIGYDKTSEYPWRQSVLVQTCRIYG